MSDTLTCPDCGTTLRTAEPLAPGTRIRCKKCERVFSVPAPKKQAVKTSPSRSVRANGDEARPRSKSRPERDDERDASPRPRRARKGENLRLAALIGGAGGLLVLGLILLLSLGGSPKKDNDRQQAGLNGGDPNAVNPPVNPPANPAVNPPAVPAPPDSPDLQKTLDGIKAATVFVKVRAGEMAGSGSGFVVKADKETVFIATNHHVVVPPVEKPRGNRKPPVPPRASVTVVFNSGGAGERAVPAEVVGLDPDRDLALLKVAGAPDLPRAIDPVKAPELYETLPVMICGFPFGEALSSDGGSPAITINKGTVSSVRTDDSGQPAVVQIDGSINPGNSGGPVVDRHGRLVGISVATLRGTRIGFAIPPHELARMIAGRVLDPALIPVRSGNGQMEVMAVVPLIDPLKTIRSVSLYHAPGGTKSPPPSATGQWPALPGASKVDLELVEGKAARGRMQFRPTEGKEDLFQVGFVDASGQTVFTEPVAFALGGAVVPDRGPDPVPAPDPIPEVRRDTLTLSMLDKFPERYRDGPVTVRANLFPVVVNRGEVCELQVFTEGNAKASRIYVTTTKEVSIDLYSEGLKQENVPVLLTGKFEGGMRGKQEIFHVTRLEILDRAEQVIHSFPLTLAPPAVPDMRALNRTPDHYLGKTFIVDGQMSGGVVGRGQIRQLQVKDPRGVKPSELEFFISIELADKLKARPRTEKPEPVRLTGTVTNEKDGRRRIVQVSQIEYLDGQGRATQTFR